MRPLRRYFLFALLPLLSHCADTLTEPDVEQPALAIVSGSGSPSGHFYFLPPIVAGTGFTGTFDAGPTRVPCLRSRGQGERERMFRISAGDE
jgi:hypothetical protein